MKFNPDLRDKIRILQEIEKPVRDFLNDSVSILNELPKKDPSVKVNYAGGMDPISVWRSGEQLLKISATDKSIVTEDAHGKSTGPFDGGENTKRFLKRFVEDYKAI